MKNIIYKALVFVAFTISCLYSPAFAGEWSVSPIRLDLSKDVKSGVITVSNSGDTKVHLQIRATEWVQDAEGKDSYEETSDIIFFPKIMTLEKHEEKVIRTGIKVPSINKEKTYRLFIEEIPEPRKAEGATVAIALRFGVPIFIAPQKAEVKGVIAALELNKGVLSSVVKNSGNTHFMISSIDIKGKNDKGEDIFSKELSGWYLLNGSSRTYSTDIPQDKCTDLEKVSIEVKTKEEISFNGKLDVDKAMCQP